DFDSKRAETEKEIRLAESLISESLISENIPAKNRPSVYRNKALLAEQNLRIIKKYLRFEALTNEPVYYFIERVEIGEKKKDSQEVCIHWKF
ncbi:MAG: DUF4368 domain-containing protein, partial [Firmicutes bacterium]|nr:DUF4368 domain-containing protein [Bacillota bacterium]